MRHIIHADPSSDAMALADSIMRQAEGSRSNDQSAVDLKAQLVVVLSGLIEQGRQVVALGSQMNAERKIIAGNAEITIKFSTNFRPSFWGRLLGFWKKG
jgi:hypothetical protein